MEQAKTYSYDLYNTETEEVEATSRMTNAEALDRNDTLRYKDEAQRWVPTPWVNH